MLFDKLPPESASVHLKPEGGCRQGIRSRPTSFQLLNYFSRNLDKLLMGCYIRAFRSWGTTTTVPADDAAAATSLYVGPAILITDLLGMQNDLRNWRISRKVVRLLALIGLPSGGAVVHGAGSWSSSSS